MKDIPTFETICGLFEQQPNAWGKARPFVKLALMIAPGAVFGSFGELKEIVGTLDQGLILNDALKRLENSLFHLKGFIHKQPNFESPDDLPRLPNAMVIFAAWFDTLAELAPILWEKLALDEYSWTWIKDECKAEYEQVTVLMGGDGRNILLTDGMEMPALEKFYHILKEKTQKIATGLEDTNRMRADWDMYPSLAVKKYCRYCEILKKYEPYRNWVGQQCQETILRILREQQSQPPRKPSALYLPPTSSLVQFRSREAELEQIRAAFAHKRIVVLSGLGGMGKTELAVAYGKTQQDTVGVYFLPFRGNFRETVALGVISGMPEYANLELTPLNAYHIALNRLRECSREDLLILDNVDDSAQSLSKVLQDLDGLPMRCLVTTRHRTAGAIAVDKLPMEELLQFFEDHDAPVSQDDRLALIEAVERHTLTVNLIAQTLQGGWVDAKTILDALNNQNFEDIPLPEVDAHFPGAEQQKKIYGHLRTVFRVTNMADPAKRVLACAVLLPQNGMSGKAFQSALDTKAAQALFTLSQNGWLNWYDGLITIHPVIRLVCKTDLNPTDESCTPFLDRLWNQYDPDRYDQTHYRHLAELFTAASDALEDGLGEWSYRAGDLWSKLGAYRKALESHEKALKIRQKALPENHPDLAQSYNKVGYAYGDLAKHKEALEYKMKALNIWLKDLPGDHPNLVQTYNKVGFSYGKLHDHENALKFKLKALKICKRTLPEDSLQLAHSYNNAGITYGDLCDHNQALEYQLTALAIRKKVLPEDHLLLASSYDTVGGTYGDLGKHNEALKSRPPAKPVACTGPIRA